MLVYDIALTFTTEVEKIWKQKFTGLTVLWFLNRWLFLLEVTVVYVAYLDPGWGFGRCSRYIRFPGFVLAFQRLVAGTIFMLRMYCLYQRDWRAPSIIAFFLVAEFITKTIALVKWAEAVVLPPGLPGCILAVAPENANKYIWGWILEIFTDLSVLCLTLYRSHVMVRHVGALAKTPLWTTILKDGTLYFLVMLVANLITVIMYLTVSQDLKAINANFGALNIMIVLAAARSISVLVSRLILNLKVAANRYPTSGHDTSQLSASIWSPNPVEKTIFGNIGNEMEGFSTNNTSNGSTIDSGLGGSKDLHELRALRCK
ncbi:uncharacterized protein FOMMEDRAFT_148482 [Fomitiporia mediterranea MF3/22]|uniref:uncharacterized protein n=1 Tax=Fomitiporia mediterranea (strain MF3/22) TaxID=694068 RepID=UPI0004408654|nr:uncharacterized protein FOMMEDRAFT_148482 [Fomitiporia mediterranea MF3/22]EJD00205.1 hypothetical protein FOMMEDRAFT_148482 [Fomitiporia mediterranea MF3/22]